MSYMSWWYSLETLSKLQIALAISISVLGAATLAVKLRADSIKKQADTRRSAERSKLDQELKEQTASALRLTKELEARTRPKSLKNRLLEKLIHLNSQMEPSLKAGQIVRYDGNVSSVFFNELKKLSEEPGASFFVSVLETGRYESTTEPSSVSVLIEIRPEILKP